MHTSHNPPLVQCVSRPSGPPSIPVDVSPESRPSTFSVTCLYTSFVSGVSSFSALRAVSVSPVPRHQEVVPVAYDRTLYRCREDPYVVLFTSVHTSDMCMSYKCRRNRHYGGLGVGVLFPLLRHRVGALPCTEGSLSFLTSA